MLSISMIAGFLATIFSSLVAYYTRDRHVPLRARPGQPRHPDQLLA